MKTVKQMLGVLLCAVLMLGLGLLPAMPWNMTVRAETFKLAPDKEPEKHEFDVGDESVELKLSYDGGGLAEYQKLFEDGGIGFEFSDPSIAEQSFVGYDAYGVTFGVKFLKPGAVTVIAKKDGGTIASFDLTVKLDELKLSEENSLLVFDDTFANLNASSGGSLYFNHMLKSAESSDPSVCEVELYEYSKEETPDTERDSRHTGDDKYCVVYPLKEGESTITVTDIYGQKVQQKITVKKSWVTAILKKSDLCRFAYLTDYNPDTLDDYYYKYSNNLNYGTSDVRVSAEYGTKVTLKVGKNTYKGEADHSGWAILKNVKLAKVGTKVTLTCELGGEKEEKTGKVVKAAKVIPYTIKARSKKGTAIFLNLGKGDVIKVKIGSKMIKKVKTKKAYWHYKVNFKSKKKLKKGQKIKYYVYNKFGQKMLSKTYKVGTEMDW